VPHRRAPAALYPPRRTLVVPIWRGGIASRSTPFAQFARCTGCGVSQAFVVALYLAFYDFCRPHEPGTPNAKCQKAAAIAFCLTDDVWSFCELIDVALGPAPPKPAPTASDRRRQFAKSRVAAISHFPHQINDPLRFNTDPGDSAQKVDHPFFVS
jgi:hypothetical protein